MPIQSNRRIKSAPEGTDLEGKTSVLGAEFKHPENVGDVFQPYGDTFASDVASRPGVHPALQGPNEQSIVASGMTVEEWKAKHPKAVMGPAPEEIGQVTTDPADGSRPGLRAQEEEISATHVRHSSAPVTRYDEGRG